MHPAMSNLVTSHNLGARGYDVWTALAKEITELSYGESIASFGGG